MSEKDEDERRCYLAALRLLNRLPYLSHQLALKLRQKQYTPKEIQSTINRLTDQALLNDPQWVDAFVRGQVRKRRGPRLIKQKLKAKGAEESLIDQALELHCCNEVEEQKLEELVSHLREQRDLNDHKEKQRAFRQLVGKGFNPQMISLLLR